MLGSGTEGLAPSAAASLIAEMVTAHGPFPLTYLTRTGRHTHAAASQGPGHLVSIFIYTSPSCPQGPSFLCMGTSSPLLGGGCSIFHLWGLGTAFSLPWEQFASCLSPLTLACKGPNEIFIVSGGHRSQGLVLMSLLCQTALS